MVDIVDPRDRVTDVANFIATKDAEITRLRAEVERLEADIRNKVNAARAEERERAAQIADVLDPNASDIAAAIRQAGKDGGAG